MVLEGRIVVAVEGRTCSSFILEDEGLFGVALVAFPWFARRNPIFLLRPPPYLFIPFAFTFL